MRVLYIVNTLGIGGAEKLTKDLAINLFQKGDTVEVLTIISKNMYTRELKQIKVNKISNKIYSIKNLINLIKMQRYLNTFDVVHVNLFPSLYYIALLSMICKREYKIIYTEHSTHNKRRNYPFMKFFERLIYKQYDEIIAISKGVKSELVKWLGISFDEKVKIYNNGVILHEYEKGTPIKLFEGDQNFKIITMIASFDERKNHRMLLEVINRLDKSIHLCLVGEGKLLKKYKAMTIEMGIADRVHFLGLRKDINNILASTDLFVLFSNWEGFGLVVIEAMAAGIPVVATNVDGLKDVVSDYGLLVENDNIHEAVVSINMLLYNSERYQEFSLKGKERANEYDIDKLVDSLRLLYKL